MVWKCPDYVKIFFRHPTRIAKAMNDEEKKYLTKTQKMRPSFEVFEKLTDILKNTHKSTDQLRSKLDNSLLQTFKTLL